MKQMIICILIILLLIPVPAAASQGGVEVGGIHILMTSVTGEPLEGAVFRLYRETESTELTDQSVDKEILPVGQEYRIMTMEQFWNNRELAGEKAETVTTNAAGEAAVYGLEYGTYYLVEETAPEGYNRITKPIRLTIHKYSHLTQSDDVRDDKDVVIDNTLHIINVRYTLPETGEMNRIPLIAGAVGVVFSAVSLLLLNRRRV